MFKTPFTIPLLSRWQIFEPDVITRLSQQKQPSVSQKCEWPEFRITVKSNIGYRHTIIKDFAFRITGPYSAVRAEKQKIRIRASGHCAEGLVTRKAQRGIFLHYGTAFHVQLADFQFFVHVAMDKINPAIFAHGSLVNPLDPQGLWA